MKRLTQSGSHVIALAVGLLVVGVVAFAGYTVMQSNDTTKASTTTPTTTTLANSINSDADLTAAAKTLDSSSSQVDSSLNDSSLDTDLNDLL